MAEGLRERKKAQTRAALRDAAIRLFGERGYSATTVADIAEAADVSPRTFFTYFPSKEAVLFADFTPAVERLEAALVSPDRTRTALATMRSWLVEDMLHVPVSPELESLVDELIARNVHGVESKGLELLTRLQGCLTHAVALDLGTDDDDATPAVVAAAAIAALYRSTRHADGSPVEGDEATVAAFDRALHLIEFGLQGLREGR
jgi:AcrR family transcriptional regulator